MYWNGKWFSYHDGSKWKSEFMPLLLFISFSIWISGSESTPCCKILFDSKQWIPRSGDGHRIQIGWMLGRRRVGGSPGNPGKLDCPECLSTECSVDTNNWNIVWWWPALILIRSSLWNLPLIDHSNLVTAEAGGGEAGEDAAEVGDNYNLNLNVKSSLGTV